MDNTMKCIWCGDEGANIRTEDGYIHQECLGKWIRAKIAESILSYATYAYHELCDLGLSQFDAKMLLKSAATTPTFVRGRKRYVLRLNQDLDARVKECAALYKIQNIEELLVMLIDDAVDVWIDKADET